MTPIGWVLLWNTMMHNRWTGPEVLYPTQAACVAVMLERVRNIETVLAETHLPVTKTTEGWCAPVVRAK